MRRFFLILLLILCGAGPAQKRLLLSQGEQADEQWIRNLAPTLWLDANDARSTWSTATAVELWKDKRADNRENGVLYSQDISQVSGTTYWQYTRATNISATEFKEDGTAGSTHILFQARPAIITGNTYHFNVSVKRGTGTRNVQLFIHRGTATDAYFKVNLGTCALNDATNFATRTAAADPVDPTYCRLSTTFVAQGTAAGNINIYPLDGAFSATIDGDNTSSLLVTRAEFRSAFADAQYHPTTTTAKLAGDNWPRFVQATAANQPAVTRRDNIEQRTLYSETPGSWGLTGIAFSGANATAAAGNTMHIGLVAAGGGIAAGSAMVETWDVTCGNYRYQAMGEGGDGGWHSLVLDCSDGSLPNKTGVTATATLISGTAPTGRYRIEATWSATNSFAARPYWGLAANGGSYRSDTPAWNAAGTETGSMNSVHIRSALADSTYLATTTVPAYRGVNGRQAVRFDGSNDILSSATVASSVLAVGAKTVGVSFRAPDTTTDQYVYRTASGAYFGVQIGSTNGKAGLRNYDGSVDDAEGAITANLPAVIVGYHDGTTLANLVNGALISAASGATTTLNDTQNLGAAAAGSNHFLGEIKELIVVNKVLGSSDRDRLQRYLCRGVGADC